LVYVWAVEQDELSKRSIPSDPRDNSVGQDVLVPWVLSKQHTQVMTCNQSLDLFPSEVERPDIYHRYYHLFADGELVALARGAAEELGLEVSPFPEMHTTKKRGVEIVQEGWERSNHYIELRRWEC